MGTHEFFQALSQQQETLNTTCNPRFPRKPEPIQFSQLSRRRGIRGPRVHRIRGSRNFGVEGLRGLGLRRACSRMRYIPQMISALFAATSST